MNRYSNQTAKSVNDISQYRLGICQYSVSNSVNILVQMNVGYMQASANLGVLYTVNTI